MVTAILKKEQEKKDEFQDFSKEDYIKLINLELRQLNSEHYFRIIYLLVQNYKKEGD